MVLKKHQKDSGFVALITAIILSVILLVVTITLSQTSFLTRSILLDSEFKERSTALAEACVDVAILRISMTPGYSATNEDVSIGTETCTIVSVSGSNIQTSAEVEASTAR